MNEWNLRNFWFVFNKSCLSCCFFTSQYANWWIPNYLRFWMIFCPFHQRRIIRIIFRINFIIDFFSLRIITIIIIRWTLPWMITSPFIGFSYGYMLHHLVFSDWTGSPSQGCAIEITCPISTELVGVLILSPSTWSVTFRFFKESNEIIIKRYNLISFWTWWWKIFLTLNHSFLKDLMNLSSYVM